MAKTKKEEIAPTEVLVKYLGDEHIRVISTEDLVGVDPSDEVLVWTWKSDEGHVALLPVEVADALVTNLPDFRMANESETQEYAEALAARYGMDSDEEYRNARALAESKGMSVTEWETQLAAQNEVHQAAGKGAEVPEWVEDAPAPDSGDDASSSEPKA